MEMEMEAGDPSSKRTRLASPGVGEDGGGADGIGSLPDAVLGEIISLLPTKDGARTQILASRWRHLWRSAPLNLDCADVGWRKFADVVQLILSSHQGPGRRFRVPSLFVNEDNQAAVEACLQSPALDNLRELELKFDYRGLSKPVPASVFRCSSTLRVVQFGHCSLSEATVQGLHFPLLKQLGLSCVDIPESSLHDMIAACPALEFLMIFCCQGASCLRISSPFLRRIGITNAWVHALELEELIIENAPRLENLLLFNDGKDLHVSVLVAPKLDTLCCTTSRLVFGPKHIQGPSIDTLATIKCLALSMPTLSLDIVIQKMRCFPCLEKLYIQYEKTGRTNLWRRKHRDLIKSLDLHLKKLVLSYYRGRNSDVDFVRFFLLNARVLEWMTLFVRTDNKELLAEQRQKLQLENRTSSGAQFHFTTLRGGRNLWYVDNVCDLALIYRFE